MSTIRDVAKLAGVSRSTVSLVLNGSSKVKEETRQMVEEVIKRIDYVPNYMARNLNNRTTDSLGVVIMTESEVYDRYDYESLTSLFAQDVTSGISRELVDTNYSIVIERFCYRAGSGDLPKIIRTRRVDGAFIIGGFYDDVFIDELIKKELPLVMVGGRREGLIDSVIPDPKQGVYLASKHLLETGHQRICLINSPRTYWSSYQRISGIERSMEEFNSTVQLAVVTSMHNTARGGYLAIKELWSAGETKYDGMIAANAPIAMGILRFLYEQKLRVPDDVSLVTHEDSILSGHCAPALTAINTRKEYMGEAAVRLLLQRLEKPDKEVETIVTEPVFVARGSVLARNKRREETVRSESTESTGPDSF